MTIADRNLTATLDDPIANISQRLADAFRFRRGTLIGARDYGSRLSDLTDRNADETLRALVHQNVAETLRHPPNNLAELELKSITIAQKENVVYLHIECFLQGGGIITARTTV